MRALSVIAAPKAAYLVTSTLLAHKHKDLLDFTLPQLHITGHAQPARRLANVRIMTRTTASGVSHPKTVAESTQYQFVQAQGQIEPLARRVTTQFSSFGLDMADR